MPLAVEMRHATRNRAGQQGHGGYTRLGMIRALFLSVGQLGDPAIIAVFLKSLIITLLLLAGLAGGLWFGAQSLFIWVGAGASATGLAGLAAALGVLLAAWLLFRAIAIAVVGVFADDVVLAVERRHYPDALAEARDLPLGRSIGMGLSSASRTILINLVLSPVYLILLITGVSTLVLFLVVNGWLLGRDLGDMVAARHLERRDLKGWRGSTSFSRFLLGLTGTGLFFVPVVNLLAPVLSAAMATHWFHSRRQA